MELEQLKDLAKYLKYKYHYSVSAEKLENALKEHCEDIGTTIEEAMEGMNALADPSTTSTSAEVSQDVIDKLASMSFSQGENKSNKTARAEKQKEAMRLIRCIISCNNQNKTELTGEIFCARNKTLPEVKKFVSFNTPTHVPLILLNMIREKQYQIFKTKKLPNGMPTKETALIPEYSIQELPPLTSKELDAIARKQLAEGYNGS